MLPVLRDTGCVFITSAVESVDDAVLENLAKHHTRADFVRALELTCAAGIALAPTFVPFTPWTTLEGYRDLLATLAALNMIEAVPPVQLVIRLLVPAGSYLLRLPGFGDNLEAFNPQTLGYPWRHRDARVDVLQREVEAIAAAGERDNLVRRTIFEQIWAASHAAEGLRAPQLSQPELFSPAPRLSEPWYCCAEPTAQQLRAV
jgi:hypothetical protein